MFLTSNLHEKKLIQLLSVVNISLFKLTDCPSCSPWWLVCWNGWASYPSCCNPARPAAPHRGRLEQRASKCPPSAWGSIVAPLHKTSSAVYHTPQHESSLEEKAAIYSLQLDLLRSKMKDEWDETNKPACPTTCSHCWGFLGVIGRRGEVPQLLCFFHVEFCIGKKHRSLSQPFFSTHT